MQIKKKKTYGFKDLIFQMRCNYFIEINHQAESETGLEIQMIKKNRVKFFLIIII